jgi:hypothetical protein
MLLLLLLLRGIRRRVAQIGMHDVARIEQCLGQQGIALVRRTLRHQRVRGTGGQARHIQRHQTTTMHAHAAHAASSSSSSGATSLARCCIRLVVS